MESLIVVNAALCRSMDYTMAFLPVGSFWASTEAVRNNARIGIVFFIKKYICGWFSRTLMALVKYRNKN
tara:strand:+ start:27711 stop:27917 length:207 start_codon:yes stop_codon:yes gene_type:complete